MDRPGDAGPAAVRVSRQDEDPGERRMPIGFNKGIQLKEISTGDLQNTRQWCRDREDKGQDWKSLIEAIDEVLEDRMGGLLGL
jgi:hypothetical protein